MDKKQTLLKQISMRYYSTLFLKSLAIADLVALRELGIFDLSDEDMGIFSYVCPSKYDYVALFNDCMEMIWKEETS